MKKRYLVGVVSLCILVGGMVGCSSKSNLNMSETSDVAMDEAKVSTSFSLFSANQEETITESTAATADSGSSSNGVNAETSENTNADYEQKLIRTVSMSVETEQFDDTVAQIESLLSQLGGYIGSSNLYNTSYNRQYSVEMRVPKDKLDAFLENISAMGILKIRYKSENSQDITLDYYDSVDHKKSLEIQQERILELLKEADSLEYIIDLEDKLSELRYQISSYESQLRRMDSQVTYSTVSMDIDEVREITVEESDSVGDRIKSGLKKNLTNVGEGFVNVFVWLITALPYLVLWAVFLTVAIVVGKKVYKRSKKDVQK